MGRKQQGCSCKIQNVFVREFLAEFLGTFVLVTFGTASIAQSVLSLRTKGSFFSINWGWGIGILLGVIVSGGVSGGHLNPAVSVALATIGKFPWCKVPHYLGAQYLGAFAASGAVFLAYWDALVWYEHDRAVYRSIPETSGIFSTFPSTHLSIAGGIFDQFLGTFLLLVCICAIMDKRNMQVEKQLVPLGVGFTVLGIGISFGYNCGYAVNPARDLAPRIFSALAGWGPGVFTEYNYWFVVPIFACHLGAVAGAWSYYLAIESNWPDNAEDEDEVEKKEKIENGNTGKGRNYLQYANMYQPTQTYQPPENPNYAHTRPHTPDDEKYQPLPKHAEMQNGSSR